MTNDGLEALAGLGELRDVRLTVGERVTDAALAHLAGLAKLEMLELRGTGFTGTGFDRLGGLPSLAHVYLNGTSVDDAGVARLMAVPSLRTADVLNSRASEAAVARLRSVLQMRKALAAPGAAAAPLTRPAQATAPAGRRRLLFPDRVTLPAIPAPPLRLDGQ